MHINNTRLIALHYMGGATVKNRSMEIVYIKVKPTLNIIIHRFTLEDLTLE